MSKGDSYTVWVCDNCMLHHMNGECGDCHTDPGHDREQWILWEAAKYRITKGMLSSRHECSDYEPLQEIESECDCETRDYSMTACEGCDSTLHGQRYAFTIWETS